MDEQEFTAYLKDRYEDQIGWYDGKAAWNKRMYKRFQWIVIVLSAVTPVLIAMGLEETRWPAVAISAMVAILTTGLKTFKYQENWINYRTTCETLRKEIHFLHSQAGEYGQAEDRESLFVERVEGLISRENTMWLTAHRKPPKEEHR